MNRSAHRSSSTRGAFTLTELLVILGVTAILGTIALNALQSAARAKVESVQCMNNHKQIIAAALLYADEFNGLWFPNQSPLTTTQTDWVNNRMDFTTTNTDNTNISKLLNPQYSKFVPYINGNPKLFHCPSDHSYDPKLGYRVRSISANAAVGTVWTANGCLVQNGPVSPTWLAFGTNIACITNDFAYGKTSDFVLPGPALTWVFADEHPNSINDAELQVQTAANGINASFTDIPGNYHNRSAPFSFADGHTELHEWTGSTLGLAPIYWSGPPGGTISIYTVQDVADNNDLIWLQQHTSARR